MRIYAKAFLGMSAVSLCWFVILYSSKFDKFDYVLDSIRILLLIGQFFIANQIDKGKLFGFVGGIVVPIAWLFVLPGLNEPDSLLGILVIPLAILFIGWGLAALESNIRNSRAGNHK